MPENSYINLLGVPAVAYWGARARTQPPALGPGQTIEGFIITSYATPGIREIEFRPDFKTIEDSGVTPYEWWPTEEDYENAEFGEKLTNLKRNEELAFSYKTKIIGPKGFPAGLTPVQWTEKIQHYLNEAQALNWVLDALWAEEINNMLIETLQALQLNEYTQAQVLLQEIMQKILIATPQQRSPEAEALLYYNTKGLYDAVLYSIPKTIALVPSEATHNLNETQELLITAMRGNEAVQDEYVSASVITGPHQGLMWSGWTDNYGKFTFSYQGTKEGTDTIVASLIAPSFTIFAEEWESQPAYITWKGGPDLTIYNIFPPVIKIPALVSDIPLKESTINIGTSISLASKTRYYISVDQKPDASDYVLGERDVPLLEPEQISEYNANIAFPNLPAGDYWLIACADADNKIIELDEENNCDTVVYQTFFIVEPPVNRPPDCTMAKAEPSNLWPPNHKMKSIEITGVSDPDNDQLSITINNIMQDEPVNGLGDGDTSPDGILQPLKVRSERSGTGNGRMYHIIFTAYDNKGGQCSSNVQVCVPHDQGKGNICIDEGAIYDSTQE